MEKKLIKKTIEIQAPKNRVWEVLFEDRFTRLWYAEFSEGTYAETDWKVGSKALFKDAQGSGLAGRVIVNKPFELLTIEHLGMIENGKEDYESDIAKAVSGSLESYHLSTKDGTTILNVECDMMEDYYESMSLLWDKALLKIKEFAEAGVMAVS